MALQLFQQAIEDMQKACAITSGKRPTKAAKGEAFRLLSGVESACAVLKVSIDPW